MVKVDDISIAQVNYIGRCFAELWYIFRRSPFISLQNGFYKFQSYWCVNKLSSVRCSRYRSEKTPKALRVIKLSVISFFSCFFTYTKRCPCITRCLGLMSWQNLWSTLTSAADIGQRRTASKTSFFSNIFQSVWVETWVWFVL